MKGEASHSCTEDKMYVVDEDGNLSRERGKWLKDSLVFRCFTFVWGCLKHEEMALQ